MPARSYGWPLAVADASSTALLGTSLVAFAAGDLTDGSLFHWAGLGGVFGFGFGGPIVHWSHGHVATGFASIGLRLAAPLLAWGTYEATHALIRSGRGGSCGSANSDISDDHCKTGSLTAAIPVAVVGVAGVMLFDALVLANEPARHTSSGSSARAFGDLTPSVQLGADRAARAVSGTLF